MDKKIVVLVVIGILLVFSFLLVKNVKSNVVGNFINEREIENLHEVTLKVEGMYCEACAYGVKAQLEELEGVINADVDYRNASGVVRYDSDKIDARSIASASTVYSASVTKDKKI